MRDEQISLQPYIDALHRMETMCWSGEVAELVGLLVKSRGPATAVGDFCEIEVAGRPVSAQVVGFREGHVLLMPMEEAHGIQVGDRVTARGSESTISVGPALLGRVLDGFGRPIDDAPLPACEDRRALHAVPPNPLARKHITEPLVTGIRAIDGMLTCGKGQRIGIFGGSGVGKSTLLGSMCRHNFADVTVVALVGERNREVIEFLDRELGPEGRRKSVVIVATSDRPAPLRVHASFVALAVSEYFRDQGADVLLVMDSVTRLAMAQREIGLAGGEPPSQKGYTPSVFALLPKIFERAGNFQRGSITGFFTVLVEGDDFNEPICDAVRALLDGHIVLSRRLSSAGHYPAIDILESVSRLAPRLATSSQKSGTQKLREALASYQRAEELIQLGAYVEGTNPSLDACMKELGAIHQYLRQDPESKSDYEQTLTGIDRIAQRLP